VGYAEANCHAGSQDTDAIGGDQFHLAPRGEVALPGGKLAIPVLPPVGGVYRFTLTAIAGHVTTYVGERANLARRIINYRSPGATQRTNLRMQTKLTDTLSAGGVVELAIVIDADYNDER
jgi:hypothetical protein